MGHLSVATFSMHLVQASSFCFALPSPPLSGKLLYASFFLASVHIFMLILRVGFGNFASPHVVPSALLILTLLVFLRVSLLCCITSNYFSGIVHLLVFRIPLLLLCRTLPLFLLRDALLSLDSFMYWHVDQNPSIVRTHLVLPCNR